MNHTAQRLVGVVLWFALLFAIAVIRAHAADANQPMPWVKQTRERESVVYWKAHELNGWVRAHTNYKSTRLPVIAQWPVARINRTFYGGNYTGQDDILAIAQDGFIALRNDWKPGADDFVLVHELVHFQQFEAGNAYPCTGAAEPEAYAVQRVFVEETGRGILPDPFTVFMLSQCGY